MSSEENRPNQAIASKAAVEEKSQEFYHSLNNKRLEHRVLKISSEMLNNYAKHKTVSRYSKRQTFVIQ